MTDREEHCCNDPEHMSPEYLAALRDRADCPYCRESASGVCTLHNGVATTDRADLPTDGLAALLQDVLRKYGGTMKGRGDHDIYDALVRYRKDIADARLATPDRADRGCILR